MNGWAVSGTRFPDSVRAVGRATIESFASLDDLPADTEPLFAANPGLFNSPSWWRNVLAFGMPEGSEALFLLCRFGGIPAGLLPLRRGPAGRLFGLTTPYTCLYQPLLAPGLNFTERSATFVAFARFCRRAGYAWFDALPADLPDLEAWQASARASGLAVLRFDSFGNWYEPVAGLDWRAYLESRAGALREIIRRRLRRAERDAGIRFQVLRDTQVVEPGIAAYDQVYARSWKQAEPFPHFNAGLIRLGADAGWLRLGLLWQRDQPIAVQLWSVERGVAMVHKLAHDEAYKALSPGTVLTAGMLRCLLDEEQIVEIDFGRGDDAYKQGWAGQRRQRIGMVLANPLRPAGIAILSRHTLGRTRAALRSIVAGT